jgi:hypothetical protein
MSSAGTIKHRKVTALPDNPNFDVSSSEWNDSLVVGGGTQSQVMVRDAGQLDGWGWSSSVPLTDVTASDHISIGTNPATTGALRLANTQAIVWRNAANSADVPAVLVTSSNALSLGTSSSSILAQTSLTPATDNAIDLGAAAVRWRSVYVGTSAKVDRTLQLSEQPLASVPTGQPIGTIANISDSQSTVSGDIVVGGGSLHVLARYNGTNWIVISTPQGGVGNVTGPGTATINDLAMFSSTNGQVLADAGILATNVARRDVANTFTASQTIVGTLASLFLHNSAAAANARQWKCLSYTDGHLYIQPADDAGTATGTALLVQRNGDITVLRDVYEKQRTTPMGHWKTYPYSAGNFSANTGTWTVDAGDVINITYALIGKTLFVDFNLISTSVNGSPTQLRIVIPEAMSPSSGVGGTPFFYSQDGGATFLVGAAIFTGSFLTLYRDLTNLTAWTTTTNITSVRGLAIVSVA